ncbi:MAG: hypothetical protein KatS3mg075_900 [Meiothermus sp.]|nr:MAG: hypothetical protein KatS3mg075_900 [Meiothermus sp.]
MLGLLIAIAVLAVLWVGGWLFTFLGTLLKGVAGVVWALLRVLVPVLIMVAVAYLALRFVQKPKTGPDISCHSGPPETGRIFIHRGWVCSLASGQGDFCQ